MSKDYRDDGVSLLTITLLAALALFIGIVAFLCITFYDMISAIKDDNTCAPSQVASVIWDEIPYSWATPGNHVNGSPTAEYTAIPNA